MTDTGGYDLTRVRKSGMSRRLRRLLIDLALRADAELVDQLVVALRILYEEEKDNGSCFFIPEIALIVKRIEAALARMEKNAEQRAEVQAGMAEEDEYRQHYDGSLLATSSLAEAWPPVIRRLVVESWRPYRYDDPHRFVVWVGDG